MRFSLQDKVIVRFFVYIGLGRKLKLLSFKNLGDVQVKEVAVQDGLHAAGSDGDDVIESWKKHIFKTDINKSKIYLNWASNILKSFCITVTI